MESAADSDVRAGDVSADSGAYGRVPRVKSDSQCSPTHDEQAGEGDADAQSPAHSLTQSPAQAQSSASASASALAKGAKAKPKQAKTVITIEQSRQVGGGAPASALQALPQAPRAAYAKQVDLTQVPQNPPFKAHVSNAPLGCSLEQIVEHFQKLKVADSCEVEMEKDSGDRSRGKAIVVFSTRDELVRAL